jgi:HAD superfamily hydrolase (TIGR01549 family)
VLKGVLLDLGNTVVKFPGMGLESQESFLGKRKSLFESLVKVIYKSLLKSGVNVSWPSFFETYNCVRAKQMEWQKRTLKEYDMSVRLAKVLSALGFKSYPSSEIIQRALEDYFESYIKHTRIEKNTPDLLKSLHSNYKLGLVTNFAYPQCIYAILGKFNLRQIFDVIVISKEVGWVKPSPKIFHAALSELGLKAQQVVFVGDDPESDILGARNVGMKTVFLSINKSRNGADVTISYLSELPAALEKLE